jgi:Histidine kinase/Y_Y_Y domain
MPKTAILFYFCIILNCYSVAQNFNTVPNGLFSGAGPLTFSEILCTSKGPTLVAGSMGLSEIDKMKMEIVFANGGLTDMHGKSIYTGKNSNIFNDFANSAGIKMCVEGPDRILYIVSSNNNLGFVNYNINKAIGFPPFNFNSPGKSNIEVSKIWIDPLGNLFVATKSDTIYFITGATHVLKDMGKGLVIPTFFTGLDKDSNFIVTKGALPVHSFTLGPGIIPYSFANDPENSRLLLIGTNNGIYAYDKRTGQKKQYLKLAPDEKLTITHLNANQPGAVIWFSTLEKGMGRFNMFTKDIRFFMYPKLTRDVNMTYPIRTFSVKTKSEYFVAIADSLPAIFNTETGRYSFIEDTLFSTSKNETSDIKADIFGNLFVSKGGAFYWSKNWMQKNSRAFSVDSTLIGPLITDILVNGNKLDVSNRYRGWEDTIKNIKLKHDVQLLEIFFSCRGIDPDSLIYSWKLDGFNKEWTEIPFSLFDEGTNLVTFENLKAGKYTLHVKAKKVGNEWVNKEITLSIIIEPPFWLTWWFWLACFAGITAFMVLASLLSARRVRKKELIKAKYEKDALELEAKALRSQMNPHFIFNCMNSIKSLINQNENEKANKYLTTFSKLMRTIFQNSDKREINLYDEIETCRLYVQLESMRFGSKLHYEFNIDSSIDLKSVQLPALIIQPFLENAIWHGIMPKEEGGSLILSIERKGLNICCIIDDDGIGREMSKQIKFRGEPSTHDSKGVHLTQNRLDVDNMLADRHTQVEIIDKKDGEGDSLGTKVILTFKDV